MTIDKKDIIDTPNSDEAKWNEQMEQDSDILDMLAGQALNDITEEDFDDEEW